MSNLIDRLGFFFIRIADAKFMIEERGKEAACYIAILVDRRTQNGAAMFLIENRIIGSAAEKADPQRGSGNDHSPI